MVDGEFACQGRPRSVIVTLGDVRSQPSRQVDRLAKRSTCYSAVYRYVAAVKTQDVTYEHAPLVCLRGSYDRVGVVESGRDRLLTQDCDAARHESLNELSVRFGWSRDH